MITRSCKAKNPATCRFHGATAAQKAQKSIQQANKKFLTATKFGDKIKDKEELKEAENLYDATDEGFAQLFELTILAIANNNFSNRVYFQRRVMLAKQARKEDAQQGKLVNVVPLFEQDMHERLRNIEDLAYKGGSDSFLDVLDDFGVKTDDDASKGEVWDEIIISGDQAKFKEYYNELADRMLETADSSSWVDAEQGAKWVDAIKNLKIDRYQNTQLFS